MPLPRLQLFEFNDALWAPEPLRETMIETLSRAIAWGHMLRDLVPPFRAFLEASGAREVLDLCAGAGAPAQLLAEELLRVGVEPPRFLLTDLQPKPEAWAAIRAAHPGIVDFVPEPVDATRIPEELGRGRARVVINALHHFPPHLAASILQSAAEDAPGVFVAESFERSPVHFGAFAPTGLAALLANPLLAPRHRLAKAWLTWCSPIGLSVALWDGLVSTLRIYGEAELRAMVRPLGDAWKWTYGTYPFRPFGRGCYFYGVRRS
ncbi:MAG: class I SAM-dependent methyltransferase [Deltaproteobacteria bacterium]|nr:class I SAM-dependent methyltransferase [Deltaproteobacteria bacterium]